MKFSDISDMIKVSPCVEYFLKCVLFVVLAYFIVQLYIFEERFSPFNKYGNKSVFYQPMKKNTGTTRFEYDYVEKPYPFSLRPGNNTQNPVSPITARQIELNK
tara:strand:+ start:879 stop:1187 length:309 start_codon:yes stop_codon:yes gene_type:complete